MDEQKGLACEHKSTGTGASSGVYLYVRCMDCGELLSISAEGKRLLERCPGYNPEKAGWRRACLNCGFDYWDHPRRAPTLSAQLRTVRKKLEIIANMDMQAGRRGDFIPVAQDALAQLDAPEGEERRG